MLNETFSVIFKHCVFCFLFQIILSTKDTENEEPFYEYLRGFLKSASSKEKLPFAFNDPHEFCG